MFPNGFGGLKQSVESHSSKRIRSRGHGFWKKTINPRGKFIKWWDYIFFSSCMIAVLVDPLFFYIPIVNDHKKCLYLDNKLQKTATDLRSVLNFFYIVYIILKFRTGFISHPRVSGPGVVVEDTWEITKKYFCSYFLLDFLAALPLPQVILIAKMHGSSLDSKDLMIRAVLYQYFLKVLRIYSLYYTVISTPWAAAAFSFFLYMLGSHAFGALWYISSIGREIDCWKEACTSVTECKFDCDDVTSHINMKYLNSSCPTLEMDNPPFDFGIFQPALQSGVVNSADLPQKFLYCFRWGLQTLSALGQNLKPSTYAWENGFAIIIAISGIGLFTFSIGNIQTYLQSRISRKRFDEMWVRKQDLDQWMNNCSLPHSLKRRITRHEEYQWQETQGVDEDKLTRNFPKDIKRDIKRHLCLQLLKRVPLFEKMDGQLMDEVCDRLKRLLYTEGSYILREGDPIDEIHFVMRGQLLTTTTDSRRVGFFNSEELKEGDICGEELFAWALDPDTPSNLPISTRTVQALEEVKAFALMADDLKFVVSQFKRQHSNHLIHTYRYYSQQWRTWAACFIQTAWRQHCRMKLEALLWEKERLDNDLTGATCGSSHSLSAVIYASRFAAYVLGGFRRKHTRKRGGIPEKLPPLMLRKPIDPDRFYS